MPGYYVFTFDMAGQYESHEAGPHRLRPPEDRFDHELFVNDLVKVLEAAPGPSHVLGYSFAGTVAQLAYAEHPDRFASLTLLSCPPVMGQTYLGMRRHGWVSRFSTARHGRVDHDHRREEQLLEGAARPAEVRAGPVRADLLRQRARHHRAS